MSSEGWSSTYEFPAVPQARVVGEFLDLLQHLSDRGLVSFVRARVTPPHVARFHLRFATDYNGSLKTNAATEFDRVWQTASLDQFDGRFVHEELLSDRPRIDEASISGCKTPASMAQHAVSA